MTQTPSPKAYYAFDSFRTTRLSRLVFALVDINTGEEVDVFFNVDIKKQRGQGEHRTGEGGQFFPLKHSKFRKFWMDTVKKEPYRWSRVHKEIRPRLKDLLFTGDLKQGWHSNGDPYMELTNITVQGTRLAQDWHNEGTKRAQG